MSYFVFINNTIIEMYGYICFKNVMQFCIVKIWGAIPTRKSVVTGKKHSPTWAFLGDVFVQREKLRRYWLAGSRWRTAEYPLWQTLSVT